MRQQPEDDLEFHGSTTTTLGVELELQIIDPPTAELVPGATRILDACRDEGIAGVDGEFLLSMIEVKTGVCASVAEVRAALVPLLRRVHNIAGSLGYDLAVGGTHPFGRPCTTAISPDERYQRIRKRQGWLAYQEAVFGLHVHVGVPDAERAIGLINLLVPYLPHLAALSANSPFWQGVDTGFALSRLVLFRPSPLCGIPLHCPDWGSFCEHYRTMREGGALENVSDLYWDIRPRHDLGTIEVRVFDAPASLAVLLGLTALTQCLVQDGLRLLQQRPELGHGDRRGFWLAAENRARAARYGLRAECVRRAGRGRRPLSDDSADLLDRLQPTAEAAGVADFLAVFRPLHAFQTGADIQRRVSHERAGWLPVVEEMKSLWTRELAELAGV